jgi:uncharacterized protein (TIGR03118 family)
MKKMYHSMAVACLLLMGIACQKNIDKPAAANLESAANTHSDKVPQSLKEFTQVNLIADIADYNPARVDARLVNGWGLSSSPGGTFWISSNVGGNSFVVNKEGGQGLNPPTIPGAGSPTGGHPTGQIFNGTTGFKLPNGNPARFIFCGDDGIISGWNGGAAAVTAIDHSATAAYFGLAIAADAGNTFIYAANFLERKIDVFDKNWNMVNKSFTDPDLPADYSPFNIQTIDGKLYVLYAKINDEGEEIHHPGFGVVDIFNADGSLMKRFVTYGQLNSPWGIAKAPKSFWGSEFDDTPSDAILIGNFGDGKINAYSNDGTFLGQLRQHGQPCLHLLLQRQLIQTVYTLLLVLQMKHMGYSGIL